jgi:hypothetical protein
VKAFLLMDSETDIVVNEPFGNPFTNSGRYFIPLNLQLAVGGTEFSTFAQAKGKNDAV